MVGTPDVHPPRRGEVSMLGMRFRGRAATVALAVGVAAWTVPTLAEDAKIGVLFGVTGPVANFVPPLLDSVKLAVDQVNAQGGILGGGTLSFAVADSQGSPQGAIDGATKLVNVEGVAAIVGALTSGATIAGAQSVAVPAGVAMVSPTATAPSITDLDDKDLLFRLVPSDAYQGLILAKLVLDQGLSRVALSYANNDYAVGIAGTFRDNYVRLGGTLTGDQVHEEKKASYRSELATLAQGDPQALVLIAYAGDSGITIVRQALENGFFSRFVGTDGLRDNLLIEQIGADNLKDTFFTSPSSPPGTSAGEKFKAAYMAAFGDPAGKLFAEQVYDAAFVTALAIEQAGSTDRTAIRDALRKVANAPGDVIEPGEWEKAVALIKAGTDINYEGTSGSIEFDAKGDVPGVIGHFVIEGGAYKEVGIVTP
jgi:branched-chain amino acid transport system substrate-binding protein